MLEDVDGAVRDPQVHYSGEKVLFSYRPGGKENFNLYEINVDGSGLRQLTHGDYDDLEATYLANGKIMFCSSRGNRWVNCWYTQVAILYVCDGDGGNILPISSNIEHDNTPWPLPDGRVLYTRWEYVDRSRVAFHHLWTSNPDGTGQMVYYGNMHPRTLMIDAKPMPGSDNEVVAVFAPGHGRREHAGVITIVSPKAGPDAQSFARPISKKGEFRDPFPLSRDSFLVAQDSRLLHMDGDGRTKVIYRLPGDLEKAGVQCHEPRPVVARPLERLIPPRSDMSQATGKLVLQDVYAGRRMEGVERGEIKKLLVLETLAKPINYCGKTVPMSFGGTFTLERILGTVPVDEDGSAYMEIPAMRPMFFVALDENNNSVKRMHSFLSVMPGETTGCVGCHEQRERAPVSMNNGKLLAMSRPASRIEPIDGVPEVFDYPRDIQPILDKHCLSCHDVDLREGGVILSGDNGPVFSHSYYTLTALGYVSDGRDRTQTNLAPRAVGTSASPLMGMLDGEHWDVKLSGHEQDMIRYWIESAAAYPGTYAALGTGMIGGLTNIVKDDVDVEWESTKLASSAIRKRCGGCHGDGLPLPKYLSDTQGIKLSNPDFSDKRIKYSRHLMFNLSRPAKSLILLGPLSEEAGGYGLCKNEDGKDITVFADTSDGDYQRILAMCVEGKQYLEKVKRFDMPGFKPSQGYVREMKRFGILAERTRDDAAIDVYETDRAYWRSLWWEPKKMAREDR